MQQKRQWVPPQVARFGTFEEATQGCNKTYGASDSFTFQGQSIVCAAS
jgi:hypothetical protein